MAAGLDADTVDEEKNLTAERKCCEIEEDGKNLARTLVEMRRLIHFGFLLTLNVTYLAMDLLSCTSLGTPPDLAYGIGHL